MLVRKKYEAEHREDLPPLPQQSGRASDTKLTVKNSLMTAWEKPTKNYLIVFEWLSKFVLFKDYL